MGAATDRMASGFLTNDHHRHVGFSARALVQQQLAGSLESVTAERRRQPFELPPDPDITEELKAADDEARQEFVERAPELLERLRKL